MIEVLPDLPDGVVGFRCADQLTRQDYETVLIPTLNAAFKSHNTLRAYCEIVGFRGMSPGAMWDDVKVGLEHLAHWERIAIVSDIDWIIHTTKLFASLWPGEMSVFHLSDAEQARAWIVDQKAPTG
jgi:hypothetical protein